MSTSDKESESGSSDGSSAASVLRAGTGGLMLMMGRTASIRVNVSTLFGVMEGLAMTLGFLSDVDPGDENDGKELEDAGATQG
jgi:hypothetical protein